MLSQSPSPHGVLRETAAAARPEQIAAEHAPSGVDGHHLPLARSTDSLPERASPRSHRWRTRSHQIAFECVDILWLHSNRPSGSLTDRDLEVVRRNRSNADVAILRGVMGLHAPERCYVSDSTDSLGLKNWLHGVCHPFIKQSTVGCFKRLSPGTRPRIDQPLISPF